MVAGIISENREHAHIPDYDIELDEPRDVVVFYGRGTTAPQVISGAAIPTLDPDVYELAREAAPGWDVRYIEREWRSWATETPKNPEMAFLGFCRKWFEKRGRP